MTFNFVAPFYRMMCVTVFLSSASLIRKLKVSNTMKLLTFVGLLMVFLEGSIQGLDFVETHYPAVLQAYRIDSDMLRILNTELGLTYQWFIDNHYIFVAFTLSVLTSRFIDYLV